MTKLKRRYEPPRIEVVPLVAEEVALAGCKTAAMGGGSGKNPLGTCTMPMPCFTPGS